MKYLVTKCDFCGAEDRLGKECGNFIEKPIDGVHWHKVVDAEVGESWDKKEEHMCPKCYEKLTEKRRNVDEAR